ncbi:MAG: ATP-binding cassette domain-containing protein [Candidatus Lokiarchaeota archaeon]|nr:ATP-binding cassette domain-containing protein [Candidatus Lokiarchaeota archaeon]
MTVICENKKSNKEFTCNCLSDKELVMKIENLSKSYGKFLAVNNLSIDVHEGETIGLVGPNGAGKTTTIKIIAKLMRPSSGRILIRDLDGKMKDLHKQSQNLIKQGFLIDRPLFYDKMTAYQLLRYFAFIQDYSTDKINDRINELLNSFKLIEWKHQKVKNFSKGMNQKLGIIQSILIDPQIIILDEPQSGLDPKARIEIREVINNLRGQGKTIFVASHMLHEISEVCDKIALINRGKLIAYDTIENLEKNLKTKELECQILEPIKKEHQVTIINKLNQCLKPYIDSHENCTEPIKYIEGDKTFKINYDGKKSSKFKILEILVNNFKSLFKVVSFTQERTTKLERIYSEMIIDDEFKKRPNKAR